MFEKINKISVQVIIAMISMIGSYGLLYFMLFKEIPTGNRDLFNAMIGVVIGASITGVLGWLYSTSKGQKVA